MIRTIWKCTLYRQVECQTCGATWNVYTHHPDADYLNKKVRTCRCPGRKR